MARLSLALPKEYDLLRIEMTKAARLRQLIAKDCVAMPGVPNASIARQVERAGFDAVYISGAGLANCTAGLPDIGLLTLTEVAMLAGFIAKTVKIPAIVDADTGFGGAVKRAEAYVAAGADAIFPEALQTKQEFRDFAKEMEVPLLANMTEFGKSPLFPFDELRELGYRMVIFPQSAFRVSMKATAEFLRDLKARGNQRDWLERMQTREELYQLLDYDPGRDSWTGYRS